MANPTTNFGWVMPTSTSLVTNLPADFNTFGQGVDTSMAQLKGGTTGQVLSKTNGTDMAFTWVTPTDQTPLTTKGDLFAFSTVDARLAVGANETRLVADSTQTVGLKYVADTTNYAINAKGDLLVGTAADTLAALTVGTNGQVLTADSTVSPTGLKWATASSGGMTLLSTTTLTGASVTLSSISGSYKLLRIFIELPLNATDSWDTKMCFNADTTANRHQNLSLATDTTGVNGSFTQTSGSITFDGLDNAVTQTLIDITIPDYANANTWKFAYATSLGNNTTTTTQFSYKSNLIAYNQTTAISSLLFKPGSGNFTSGTIYLYGVN